MGFCKASVAARETSFDIGFFSGGGTLEERACFPIGLLKGGGGDLGKYFPKK